MKTKTRILIFVDGLVYPPKEGINKHVVENANFLCEKLGFDVYVIVGDRGWIKKNDIKKEGFVLIYVDSENFHNLQYVEEIISDLRPDIIQTHSPSYTVAILGQISLKLKIPLLLEFHDIEKELAQEFKEARSEFLYQDRLQVESAKYANLVRVMSSVDYKILANDRRYIKNKLIYLPVCIRQEINFRQPNNLEKERKGILFVGNMCYLPNKHASEIIVREIAPNLRTNNIFYLVGRTDTDVKSKDKRIIYTGPIDDLSKIAKKCCLALAPILEGSGMKIKLLTYLSSGLPVITTPKGVAGYKKSEAIIVRRNCRDFAKTIVKLILNSSRLAQLSDIASQYFFENFSFENNKKKIKKLYSQVLKKENPDLKRVKRHFIVKVPRWLEEKR